MRVALDSNVIIYAEGGQDEARRATAHAIIGALYPRQISISIQATAETWRWLIKKGGIANGEATKRVQWWLSAFTTQDTDRTVFDGAAELVSQHKLQVFDAIILAAARAASADVLLSEDMHDGFSWRGVMVVNPFATNPLPVISQLLRG